MAMLCDSATGHPDWVREGMGTKFSQSVFLGIKKKFIYLSIYLFEREKEGEKGGEKGGQRQRASALPSVGLLFKSLEGQCGPS